LSHPERPYQGCPPFSPYSDLGFVNAPLGWQFADHGMKFFVERNANFDPRDFTPTGNGPIGDAALNLFDSRTEAGDADDAAGFDPFIAKNKKLLIYHGLSDPALTAFRSVMLYEALSRRQGGVVELQETVRLFGVPGMHHCGGGPGPNSFDTLTALENWVEHSVPPDGIIATKFVNDTPAQGISRTMPLCKFPEEAKFIGNAGKASTTEIGNTENWTCAPGDERMLETGTNGINAGLDLPQAAEIEVDQP
jgi:feruloyl esterase